MKTIEVCRVEPSPHGSSCSPTLLPLTFFDIFWLRLPPVQRIFFYTFPHPPSHFFHSLLPSLKLSLSLSLSHFLPLSGHLSWPHNSPKPFITYDPPHDAVSLTIAESRDDDDADFDVLSGFGLSDATKCHNLIPHLDSSHDRSSVLALQITLFPNSGFSIAISCHHAVLDGKSSTSFVKSWAYLCKNNLNQTSSKVCFLPPDLVPCFDRSLIKDPKGLEPRYVSDWLSHGGPNNRSLEVWNLAVPEGAVRGVFELTRSDIEKLKNFVASKRRRFGDDFRLSTFVVCCGYAWVCRVKAEEVRSKRVMFAINVDCRGRLEPPLPATYFGNCVGNRMAVAETRELVGEDGVVVAVEAMVEALESLKEGLLNGAERWVSKLQGALRDDDERIIGGAGTPRFEVYGIDFGWGRPKKVEMTSVDRTGAIWFSDGKNGDGGVEIGLVLKKNEMEEFASLFVKDLEFISPALSNV